MDRLEQLRQARLRARGVKVVKLAGQDRYLARSRTFEPGSYFEPVGKPLGPCSLHLSGLHLSRALQARRGPQGRAGEAGIVSKAYPLFRRAIPSSLSKSAS